MKLETISKYPSDSTHPTPLLFIHGTLHGAWCWDVHFLDYFAQHGFVAHAVNLRGHGNSEWRGKLRWTRIADYVEDVANTIRQLPSPPILIGHSMGGFIIRSIWRITPPRPYCYLAILPGSCQRPQDRPAATARLCQGQLDAEPYPLIATPHLARQAFFSDDLEDELLAEYWKQMQEDSFRAFLDMVALDLPKPAKVKTPLLVLGVAGDNMLKPGEIEATARAYKQSEIIADVAHNSMLEPRWQAIAERILFG
jgi:pimeloyl-ACP methyl ester carboxylesterase